MDTKQRLKKSAQVVREGTEKARKVREEERRLTLGEESERRVEELVLDGLDVLGRDAVLALLPLLGDLSELVDKLLDVLDLGGLELVLELVERLLGLGGGRVGSDGHLDKVFLGLVGLGKGLGVLDHVLDLGVGKTGRGSDGHRLVFVGGLVLGGNVDDTVLQAKGRGRVSLASRERKRKKGGRGTYSIDVKSDLDLGDTLVGRGDTGKLEVSELLVVSDHGSLSLVDLDLDGGLTVNGGRESLRLLGGDSGVSGDERREDTSEGLDT
jgi:hypothetical protein